MWSDFTNFSTQVSANSLDFRFRSLQMLFTQNMSKYCSHKYNQSISRVFLRFNFPIWIQTNHTWRRISSVTRWTPRCWGRKCILRCSQAGWPTIRPWPMPEPEPLLWLAEHAMLLSRDLDDGWGWGWWDGGGVRPRWQLATVVTVVPAPPTAETASSSLAAAAELAPPAEHPAASTLATVARCPWPDATMLTIQVYPVKKAATLTGAGVGLNLDFFSRLSNTGI